MSVVEIGTENQELKQIRDMLDVPAMGQPLLKHRNWTLPCPDKTALDDHPGPQDEVKKVRQTCTSYEESNTEQSPGGSRQQAGRK